MKRTLPSAVACTALLFVAAGQVPDPPTYSAVDAGLGTSASVHGPDTDAGSYSLSDQVLTRTAGTGPTSDFLCGAATGAGFALALSGVGAGLGIALGGIGMACAMFF